MNRKGMFDEQVTKFVNYDNELENVREMNAKITQLNQDRLNQEQKCRDLFLKLQEIPPDNEEINELKEENESLDKYINTFQKDVILKNTGKTLDQLHPNSRLRIIVNLENLSQKALWFAESFGLTPEAIKFVSETGKNII